METVRATSAVDCPIAEADALVIRFFETQRDRSGAIHMLLHVPLEDFGLATRVSIARDVEVGIERGRDAENLNDLYRVTWQPAGGGPFPALNGTLTLWCEDDPNVTNLELEGSYEPPLGNVIGEAFDATIGHLIAERTAKQFVERVADGISALRSVR